MAGWRPANKNAGLFVSRSRPLRGSLPSAVPPTTTPPTAPAPSALPRAAAAAVVRPVRCSAPSALPAAAGGEQRAAGRGAVSDELRVLALSDLREQPFSAQSSGCLGGREGANMSTLARTHTRRAWQGRQRTWAAWTGAAFGQTRQRALPLPPPPSQLGRFFNGAGESVLRRDKTALGGPRGCPCFCSA